MNVLDYLEKDERHLPTIVGGDLNTWSFDKRDEEERARLARDPATPGRLLRPMPWEPLFEELTANGYRFEDTNDLSRGTYPVPGFPIEARLDWIVTKGLCVSDVSVWTAPHSERRGGPVSDHHAVSLTVRV